MVARKKFDINSMVSLTDLWKSSRNIGIAKPYDWSKLDKTNKLIKYYCRYYRCRYGQLIVNGMCENANILVISELAEVYKTYINSIKKREGNNQILPLVASSGTSLELETEQAVQRRLFESLKGQREVAVPSGYIDILTATELIEIKSAAKWKEAVGQVLVYGHYYPKHRKRIHLFNVTYNTKIEMIRTHLDIHDIRLTMEAIID